MSSGSYQQSWDSFIKCPGPVSLGISSSVQLGKFSIGSVGWLQWFVVHVCVRVQLGVYQSDAILGVQKHGCIIDSLYGRFL